MATSRRILLSLCMGAVAGLLMAAGPKKTLAPAELKSVPGKTIRADLGLTGVSGWILVDLTTGKVVDQHNADRVFVPASVAKLPTAAFVLDALGPGYRFETRVKATGKVAKGRVKGTLVLEGGGDPELDTDALGSIAKQLKAKGITRVDGAFLVDGSALPQLREIEPNQGVDASYNASISGLNLNFNRVHVKWDARKGRNVLSVEAEAKELSPKVSRIRVSLADGKGLPLFSLKMSAGRENWLMARRAFRGRAARWLPVKQPEAYAAEVFRTVCATVGVKLPKPGAGKLPGKARVLLTHKSRPVASILRDMLRFSTNITAEVTGSAATRTIGIAAGSLKDSAEVMNAWAASVAGFKIGDPGFRFANHSGLSLNSRVSPRRMVELLVALGKRAPDAGAAHPRLPGGIAGYLRRHNVAAKDVPLDYDRLAVVAKTGTMSYVRGLAGYFATPGGRKFAFVIFSNDLDRRGSGAQRVNKRWMGRAKGFERALIRSWVIKADGLG